ncbi:MAG: hypothetical protein WEG36_02995 [Gemmatimonadota bacterium]
MAPVRFRETDGDDYLAFRVNDRGTVTHRFTRTWRGRWRISSRLHYTAITLSGLALVILLARHGLIPPVW